MYVLYIATGWPPAIAGMFLTWYLANKKVQKITDDQTRVIQGLTNRQTRQLLGQPLGLSQDPPADGV